MKISDVSKKYNISPDTLRYYEKIGLLPKIVKNKTGIRQYSESDCKQIEFILCMRGAGLSIEILKKYLDLASLGPSTLIERRELLKKEREKLYQKRDDILLTIDKLNYKIDVYYKELIDKELSLNK